MHDRFAVEAINRPRETIGALREALVLAENLAAEAQATEAVTMQRLRTAQRQNRAIRAEMEAVAKRGTDMSPEHLNSGLEIFHDYDYDDSPHHPTDPGWCITLYPNVTGGESTYGEAIEYDRDGIIEHVVEDLIGDADTLLNTARLLATQHSKATYADDIQKAALR